MRALDSESDFAVQVLSLRASGAAIAEIIRVISRRDNEMRASRPHPSGHVASAAAGPPAEKAKRVCYLFQKGECTYGQGCKFEHTPVAGTCLACGSAEHGLDRCPLKKASDRGDKKPRGHGGKEMTAMRAQLDALVSQLEPHKDKATLKGKKAAKDKKAATQGQIRQGQEEGQEGRARVL